MRQRRASIALAVTNGGRYNVSKWRRARYQGAYILYAQQKCAGSIQKLRLLSLLVNLFSWAKLPSPLPWFDKNEPVVEEVIETTETVVVEEVSE